MVIACVEAMEPAWRREGEDVGGLEGGSMYTMSLGTSGIEWVKLLWIPIAA